MPSRYLRRLSAAALLASKYPSSHALAHIIVRAVPQTSEVQLNWYKPLLSEASDRAYLFEHCRIHLRAFERRRVRLARHLVQVEFPLR
jgi:hypothetical protein